MELPIQSTLMDFLPIMNYNFTHVIANHGNFGDMEPIWLVNALPNDLPVKPFFFNMAESILYWYANMSNQIPIPYGRDENGFELLMVRPLGSTIEQIWNSMTIFENIKVLGYSYLSIQVNRMISFCSLSLKGWFFVWGNIYLLLGHQEAYNHMDIFGHNIDRYFFEQFHGNITYGLSDRESILFDVYDRWLYNRTNMFTGSHSYLHTDVVKFTLMSIDLVPNGIFTPGDMHDMYNRWVPTRMLGYKYAWFWFPHDMQNYYDYANFMAGRDQSGIIPNLGNSNVGFVLPTFSIAAFIGIGISIGLYLHGVNIDAQVPLQLANA